MTNPVKGLFSRSYFDSRSPKLILLLTLGIIFVDLLGASLVLPILPVLFSSRSPLFNTGLSAQSLNILYGLLIASYPLAQLFGAPILGFYSDTIGRKKVLLLSLAGTALSYTLSAVSIATANLPLLFFARLLDGFTGGNVLIAQSIIADISNDNTRPRNFGLVNIAVACGTIFGPLIGGLSSEVKLWFGISRFSSPFVLATIVVLLNIAFLSFTLKETYSTKINQKNTIKSAIRHLNIFSSFQRINRALKMPKLKNLFLVSFLSSLAFSLFINFFPKYLIDNFEFTARGLGFITAYTGVCLVIIVLIFFTKFAKKTEPGLALSYSLLAASIGILFLLIPDKTIYFYFILPIVSGALGIISPIVTNAMSESVTSEQQGEILGVNQSVQAFATLAPVFGGIMINIWDKLPLFTTGLIYFVGWLIVRTQNPVATIKNHLTKSAELVKNSVLKLLRSSQISDSLNE